MFNNILNISMNSLQSRSFAQLFDVMTIEKQVESLNMLLKTTSGEKVLRQIKVDEMMKYFDNPIVKRMLERCEPAQEHFLKYDLNISWKNINLHLHRWFNKENINVYTSEDNKVVCIDSFNPNPTDIVINDIVLKVNQNFDLKEITEGDFDLNNLYMVYTNYWSVWWEFCDNLA